MKPKFLLFNAPKVKAYCIKGRVITPPTIEALQGCQHNFARDETPLSMTSSLDCTFNQGTKCSLKHFSVVAETYSRPLPTYYLANTSLLLASIAIL